MNIIRYAITRNNQLFWSRDPSELNCLEDKKEAEKRALVCNTSFPEYIFGVKRIVIKVEQE